MNTTDPTQLDTLTVVVLDPEATLTVEHWTRHNAGDLLTRLQAAVGGPVNLVALSKDLTMYVHYNGISECTANPWATGVLIAHGRMRTPIFGTVALVGGVDATGDDLPAIPLHVDVIHTIVQTMRENPTMVAALTQRQQESATHL